ncbi:MAG: CHRD domain-containing protein [Chthonomonadales bacterium]|nr:CHRD domain-containing protein [Chthonomonadales bacterium]
MRRMMRAITLTTAMLMIAAAGHAQLFMAGLDGASEAPPNASPGTGEVWVTLDSIAHTMRVQVTFADLLGMTTASHIHAATAVPGVGTAGVATPTPTFPGFPLGVTAGSYDVTLDMTLPASYNASYLTAHGGTPATAEADLFAAITDGRAYLNVHTALFPGGEIRGFLQPVPEPGAVGLIGGLALAGWLLAARRRR